LENCIGTLNEQQYFTPDEIKIISKVELFENDIFQERLINLAKLYYATTKDPYLEEF
jgi:hypothetical protein